MLCVSSFLLVVCCRGVAFLSSGVFFCVFLFVCSVMLCLFCCTYVVRCGYLLLYVVAGFCVVLLLYLCLCARCLCVLFFVCVCAYWFVCIYVCGLFLCSRF